MSEAHGATVEAVHVHTYSDPPAVTVARIPLPRCGPGEVLIAPRAAAVHHADVLMMRGDYQTRPELPFVPGMEAAGDVIEVGDGVTHVAPGDRVLAVLNSGAMANLITVTGPRVARIPESMTYCAAATFGIAYVSAYAALHFRAGLQPGETVVVTGARGSVGRAVVRMAKARGAVVIAASRDADRCRSDCGGAVDHVVDADPDSVAAEIKSATAGRGADVVVDLVGGELLGQLVRATAWEGRIVVVGFAAGTPAPIKPGHLLVKNISVSGLQTTDYWSRRPKTIAEVLHEVVTSFGAGSTLGRQPLCFPLTQVDAAMHAVVQQEISDVVIEFGEHAFSSREGTRV